MQDNLKIATWNLCLGLANKKDYVSGIIRNSKIYICCIQETDVIKDIYVDTLSFKGFTLYLKTTQ